MTAVIHLHSPVSLLVVHTAPRVPSTATLTTTSQVMRAEDVSAVLVGPGHTAIATERDLTRALALECPPDTAVSDIATPLPISVPGQIEILEAAALMLNHEVRHLLVETPEGGWAIVSLRAVMAVLLQAAQPDLWLSSLRVKLEVGYPEMWVG
jgi:CBS domain-containing protein